MPIEMPRGLPFSVDTWTPSSNRKKRHHFLTHAHKDHLVGIGANSSYPIYATRLTISILLSIFQRVDESIFVEVEVGKPISVRDPDGDFFVTAFDANHCPGAIMFLFEGEFGNVLHTGDCRLDSDCLQSLPMKYITKKGKETLFRLDYLFLDCTFARCFLSIPSKQTAIQQVINCIWNHPDAPVVYLACDLLGQEEILLEISKTFGSKIYVDKSTNAQCLQALSLIAPEILSEDVSSRFQVFSFTNLYERVSIKLAEARESTQLEPVFIRPSTQWYACDESSGSQSQTKMDLSKAVRDDYGLWHVCYSMHSSREELESGLQLLQPKWVISTTPPCRAMELDYVKRHCFKTQIDSDDPLWKLLNYAPSHSKTSLPKANSISNASSEEYQIQTSCVQEERQIQSKELSMNSVELQIDSIISGYDKPISKQITLFGRARLGLHDNNELREETSSIDIKPKQVGFSVEDTTVSSKVVLPDAKSDQLHDTNMKGSHYHQLSRLQDCSVHHSSHELKGDNIEDHYANNIRIEEPMIKKESSSCTIGTSSKGLTVIVEDHYPNNIRIEESKIEKVSSCTTASLSKDLNVDIECHYPNYIRSEETKIEQDFSSFINGSSKGLIVNVEDYYPNYIRIEEPKVEKESSSCTIASSSKGLNVNIEDPYPNNIRREDVKIEQDCSSCIIGSSKVLNPSLRKLYRSMNVPVPSPLPSLTKLMDMAKRPRTRY